MIILFLYAESSQQLSREDSFAIANELRRSASKNVSFMESPVTLSDDSTSENRSDIRKQLRATMDDGLELMSEMLRVREGANEQLQLLLAEQKQQTQLLQSMLEIKQLQQPLVAGTLLVLSRGTKCVYM